ncbi:hypothetical protein [Nonomuraea sp. NPDC003754]
MKATVLRIRQPFTAVVPGLPERAGREYIGIEVRMCIAKSEGSPTNVSWGPWSIEFADETVEQAMSSWGPEWWDVPLYPNGRQVQEGRCVRGWIPFEVQKGAKPRTVSYQPSDMTLEWQVK